MQAHQRVKHALVLTNPRPSHGLNGITPCQSCDLTGHEIAEIMKMRSTKIVMPPRPSRGLTRGAPSSASLAEGDKWATGLASSGAALATRFKLSFRN